MASTANSTSVSRREALFGITVASVAIAHGFRGPRFEPHAYIARLRAVGGRIALHEEDGAAGIWVRMPVEGWTDEFDAEYRRLREIAGRASNSDELLRIALRDEGSVVTI